MPAHLIALAPILALIALVCWAISSPIGSSPDEDYHLPSIWCGQGDRPGLCESVPGHPDERSVSRQLTDSSACFAFQPDHSGACQIPAGDKAPTSRGNFSQHLYPPLYYAVTSIFATTHIGASVLAIRAFNVVLFTLLATILYWLLPPPRRRTLVWGIAITIVPLASFVIASVNPSSWTITSAAVLWLALVGYYETTGWRRIGLAIVAGVATIMGGGSRADGALFAVMAVAIAVILVGAFRMQFLIRSVYPAVLVFISAALYLTGAQAGALTAGLVPPDARIPTVALLWGNLVDVLSLVVGGLVTWALGWFDTTMPAAVWVPTISVFAVVVFLAVKRPGGRKIFAVSAVGLGLIVLPMWLLFSTDVFVGTQVQPRYVLPVLVIFAGVTLFQDKLAARLHLTRGQLIVLVALLGIANAVALHQEIRRYVSGLDYVSPNLDHGVEWWWGVGLSPMTVWAIGAVSFAAALYLAASVVTRWSTGADADVADPADPADPADGVRAPLAQ